MALLINQIDRYESMTPGGAEIIRKFVIDDYTKHSLVIRALLGGVNLNPGGSSGSTSRILPLADIYYSSFYCYRAEAFPLSSDGFASMDGIIDSDISKSLTRATSSSGGENPTGGAIIVAHYLPIMSAGDSGNKFNYVNYSSDPYLEPIPIPKGGKIDMDVGFRPKYDLPDDIKIALFSTYYKISFTRMNIPWTIYQEDYSTITRLMGKVNGASGGINGKSSIPASLVPLFGNFPGMLKSPSFDAETLRFDGVTPINKVGFEDSNTDSQRMVDMIYHWTHCATYDECYNEDGTSQIGSVGFNRTLLFPGTAFNKGSSGSSIGVSYFNVGWYRYGWSKNYISLTNGLATPYVWDTDICSNGFNALFSSFTT